MQEVILGGAGMMGWLLVCGIAASVSQNTIIDTGERFGWMGVSYYSSLLFLCAFSHGYSGFACITYCSKKNFLALQQFFRAKFPLQALICLLT